jgi:mRNA interferase MazF
MNENVVTNQIRRGDVFLCDLGTKPKGVQGGLRPVLITQNNLGNFHSPSCIVVPLTSQVEKCLKRGSTNECKLPTHVFLDAELVGLAKNSVALTEQTTTVSKEQLLNPRMAHIDEFTMARINEAIMIAQGLIDIPKRSNTKELAHA